MFSNKKITLISSLVLSLILLGAGCGADQGNQNQQDKSGVQKEMKEDIEEATEDQTNKNQKSGLTLEAEPRGEGKVHFEWEVSDNKEVDRFIIVRDEKANPKHNGKNYWFRQPGTRRSITWVDIPTGTYHFRICILENNECAEYSNDVKVEVK
ncbi:MAG: hypothetical protein ABEJ02_00540 [Candidatus Paceibacteria bacterium]